MNSPLWSLKILAKKLGIDLGFLEEAARNAGRSYSPFLKKRPGKKPRTIDNPSDILKAIQRKILSRLLEQEVVPKHLHGSLKGRSPTSNAENHLGQRFVIRIDIVDFFPSVSDRQIYDTWITLGYGATPARLLTALTTFRHRLPQGAPTSSLLANLVLKDADKVLVDAAASAACNFTRYVDDLVFSGDFPQRLVQCAAEALQNAGFRVSRKKLVIMPSSSLQEVTGLGVNSPKGPSIPRYKRSKIRAGIHQLPMITHGPNFNKAAKSLARRIAHIEKLNPKPARALKRSLAAALVTRADCRSPEKRADAS